MAKRRSGKFSSLIAASGKSGQSVWSLGTERAQSVEDPSPPYDRMGRDEQERGGPLQIPEFPQATLLRTALPRRLLFPVEHMFGQLGQILSERIYLGFGKQARQLFSLVLDFCIAYEFYIERPYSNRDPEELTSLSIRQRLHKSLQILCKYNDVPDTQVSLAVDVLLTSTEVISKSCGHKSADIFLPTEPVVSWSLRSDEERDSSPVEFLKIHWGKYIDSGVMFQCDLRRLDNALFQAVLNYCKNQDPPIDPKTYLPPRHVKAEWGIAKLKAAFSDASPEEMDAICRAAAAYRTRLKREASASAPNC